MSGYLASNQVLFLCWWCSWTQFREHLLPVFPKAGGGVERTGWHLFLQIKSFILIKGKKKADWDCQLLCSYQCSRNTFKVDKCYILSELLTTLGSLLMLSAYSPRSFSQPARVRNVVFLTFIKILSISAKPGLSFSLAELVKMGISVVTKRNTLSKHVRR